MQTTFHGFSTETFRFLFEIGLNNYKSWFEANKPRYQSDVQQPMKALVTDLADYFKALDPAIETNPQRIISRIYRDVRFSKDKTPYRDNVWCTFKRPVEDWHEIPTFYFEITPAGYSYGMGYYMASKETMDKFRQWIVKEPDQFRQCMAHFEQQSLFKLEGDRYKKILNPELHLPEDLRKWYQFKNFYFFSQHPLTDAVFSEALVTELKEAFDLLKPIYESLKTHVG